MIYFVLDFMKVNRYLAQRTLAKWEGINDTYIPFDPDEEDDWLFTSDEHQQVIQHLLKQGWNRVTPVLLNISW